MRRVKAKRLKKLSAEMTKGQPEKEYDFMKGAYNRRTRRLSTFMLVPTCGRAVYQKLKKERSWI